MTKIISLNNHIHQSIDEVQQIASDHTYPLYAANESRCPEVYASCVFLEYSEQVYLVTAAHAIYEIEKSGSSVHVGFGKILPLSGESMRSSLDGKDPLDIAIIPVDHAFVKEHLINVVEIEKTCFKRDFKNPFFFLVYGYPCSKNDFRKQAKKKIKHTTTNAFTFAGSKIKSKYYSINKKSEEIHIGILYNKEGGRTKNGTNMNPPKPKGISGGGCWVTPELVPPHSLYLAGIFTETHGPHIYATKIDAVIEFISEHA